MADTDPGSGSGASDPVEELKARLQAAESGKLGPVSESELERIGEEWHAAQLAEVGRKVRELVIDHDHKVVAAVIGPLLDDVPPAMWDLVPAARALNESAKLAVLAPSKASERSLANYDTARVDFSFAARHALREPDALARAILVLDLIRQEVRRAAAP